MRPDDSRTVLDGILCKLADDPQFRSEFETNRGEVLQRFSLTREQHAALLSLDLLLFSEVMVQLSDTSSGVCVDTII